MVLGKHFSKYYLKYFYLFLLGLAALIMVDIVQLEIPKHVANIIAELTDHTPQTANGQLIEQAIMTIFGIVLLIVLGRILWRFLIFGTARQIEFELRNQMFSQALRLSQSFYSKEKVGGMMTYFINDLEALRMAFGPGLLMLVDGLFLGFFSIRKMYLLSPILTLYATIPMILMTIAMVVVSRFMQKKFKERQKSFETLSDFTQENFSGISVIKAFVKETLQFMFFRKKNEDLNDKTMVFIKQNIWVNIGIGVAINLVVLIILGYGSYLVLKNPLDLSAADLSEYIQYYFTLIWPTMAIAQYLNIQAQANASKKRIADFLDQGVEVKDQESAKEVADIQATIEAKNLTFQYPDGDHPVLKNVNFTILEGEMVGILGRTGSGKSSLVELLLRLYNVDKGMLYIGGYDVNDIKIRSIRHMMGYVPQDNFLFSETIRDNIGFSYDAIEADVLNEAAKLSDVYDNIMNFQYQFDTMLGERGVTVSGGQKQRISIARALAKDPKILILDDSVSAVDTQTEEAIIHNMHKIRKGKTTIFIAHRISTVKKMDKIILLEKGEVVAVGTHDQLMKTSPLYQHMVRLQTLEHMLDEGGDSHERL